MEPDVIAHAAPAARLFRPEPVAWEVSPGLTDYAQAVARMEREAAAIAAGGAGAHLARRAPAALHRRHQRQAGRPHRSRPLCGASHRPRRAVHLSRAGPAGGLRDARSGRRGQDVRAFVTGLEAWIIATLAEFGVAGETRPDRVGVWVRRPQGQGDRQAEDKIAAIGIRVRRWVTFHGARSQRGAGA
jgi:lipoyl(octanoyl) transferase